MIELSTAIKLKNFRATKTENIKRHPILAAMDYEYQGRSILVTDATLQSMVALLQSGDLGPERPVTIAHPDMASSPAVGWIIAASAAVEPGDDGKAYLAADIRWSDRAMAMIEAEEYGYISAAFTMDFRDMLGSQRGPALLGAGIVNDPHWKTQPMLQEQFEASLQPPTQGDNKMEEQLKELQAQIAALAAAIAEIQKAMAGDEKPAEDKEPAEAPAPAPEMQAKMQAQEQQLVAFKASNSAMEKRLQAIEAERKQERGNALIEKFTAAGHIKEKHLFDAEGKPTRLQTLAYDDPQSFIEFAAMLPIELPPRSFVGGQGNGQELVNETNQALELAKDYHDKHRDKEFDQVYFAACKAIEKGSKEINL